MPRTAITPTQVVRDRPATVPLVEFDDTNNVRIPWSNDLHVTLLNLDSSPATVTLIGQTISEGTLEDVDMVIPAAASGVPGCVEMGLIDGAYRVRTAGDDDINAIQLDSSATMVRVKAVTKR